MESNKLNRQSIDGSSLGPYGPFMVPLEWQGGAPVSSEFHDVYYSDESGPDETRHVFLEPNRLKIRMKEKKHFVIGELGFGTGLNFFSTWDLWQKVAPADGKLFFYSAEKYPLSREKLTQIFSSWGSRFKSQTDEFLRCYSHVYSGFQIFDFCGGRVRLVLMVGDARSTLSHLRAPVDAWFLDGFAPRKNPEMWELPLLWEVARRSGPGTTFSTYSSLDSIQSRLEEVGFRTERVPGFGRKKNMLRGEFQGQSTGMEVADSPWFRWGQSPLRVGDSIAVVGGGLAGTAAAHALASRGFEVTLVEKESRLAAATSGNRTAVFSPAITAQWEPRSRFSHGAFGFLGRQLGAWGEEGEEGSHEFCGVLQLAQEPHWENRFQKAIYRGMFPAEVQWLDQKEASEKAGVRVSHGGIYFPEGGWLDPQRLCALRMGGPQRSVRTSTELVSFEWKKDQWHLQLGHGQTPLRAKGIVIANGNDAHQFSQTRLLNLRTVRGQVAHARASEVSRGLRCVVTYDGYVTPARRGEHSVGATHDRYRLEPAPREEENRLLLDRLSTQVPGIQMGPLQGQRVGLRTVSADSLPVVGPVPQWGQFEDQYGSLWKGKPERTFPDAHYEPGLYVSLAHGGRGAVTSALAGEFLASQMAGEPSPIEGDLHAFLHPGRFLIREYRRAGVSSR